MSTFRAISGTGLLLALGLAAAPAAAQAPTYGAQITLETAKKITAAAVVEAVKNKWPVAIAIVDNHGFLVYYERLDDTQTSSPAFAVEKARTAAMFRRPSQALEDASKTRVAVLGFPGATPITGGLPSWSTARSSEASASAGSRPSRTSRWRGPASTG